MKLVLTVIDVMPVATQDFCCCYDLRSSLGPAATLLGRNNSVYSKRASVFPTPLILHLAAVSLSASNTLTSGHFCDLESRGIVVMD